MQSDSEQYAIKSDILSSGTDFIVKSPTIESMSGKSFDDNFSNPDYDNNNYDINTANLKDYTLDLNLANKRSKRIEKKFDRLSAQLEPEDLMDKNNDFDAAISNIKDEVSLLQNDFSKISWDESYSATTGDLCSNTPDNDLQGDFSS